MPIVDDPFDFGRIAATNAISDVYAMGGTPIMALAIVGMPIEQAAGRASSAAILARRRRRSAPRPASRSPAATPSIRVEPIYGLVVMGLVHPDRVRRNADARAGDVLVLGKPLGVGVLSAALKKGALDAAGYARLIATTTRLNKPGLALAELAGVHAITDVTGFGLAGHALEMARGAGLRRADRLAGGAAARRRRGAGARRLRHRRVGPQLGRLRRRGAARRRRCRRSRATCCTDPQTSGGLLVSLQPGRAWTTCWRCFRDGGFADAAVDRPHGGRRGRDCRSTPDATALLLEFTPAHCRPGTMHPAARL